MTFRASPVVLSLSNLFIINISIIVGIVIAKYIIILIFQFPVAMFAPANVEDIIDGVLASVDIIINLTGCTGNKPDIYTSKSLGVPGNRNNINIIFSILFGFL